MTSIPEDVTGNGGFAEAYSLSTGRRQQVPRHWIGDPVLGLDFALTPAQRELDGDLGVRPAQDWTVKEIDDYAERVGVDVSKAKTKDKKLAAIEVVFARGDVQTGLVAPDPVEPAAEEDQPVAPAGQVDTAPGTSPADGDPGPGVDDTTETPGDGDKE